MSDKQRQQIREEQDDKFLQELFSQAAEETAEAQWKAYQAEVESGTAPEIPEELDAKCRELLGASGKKQKKSQLRKFVGIGLKNAAIVVLVLLVLTSTAVMSVDAIRVPVMNLLVVEKNRKSSLFFGMTREEEKVLSPADKVRSTRLPDGYELKTIQELPNGNIRYQFEDSNEALLQVIIMSSETMIDFDTEDIEQVSTTIYDWPAVYLEKKGHRVMWFNSDLNYVFDVHATELDESAFWEYVYRLAK